MDSDKETVMQTMIKQATQRWQQLSQREQRLLLLMAIVLGGALFYQGLWVPAHRQSASLAATVARLKAEQQLVATLASEAHGLKPQAALAPMAATELKHMLQPLLQQAGLDGLQLAEDGDFGVRVSGEVVFDDWVKTVGALAMQQVRVVRLQADASSPGRVKLEAVLAHAGGEA